MGLTYDKARWDQTYGTTLSGNINQGVASDWFPCTITNSVVTLVGHGWTVDQQVHFRNASMGIGSPLYVRNPTADTFELSTFEGDPVQLMVHDQTAEVAEGRRRDWLSYGRELWAMQGSRVFEFRRDRILAAFPEITTADRILVVGCSFVGMLVQRFREAGYTECYGLDDSDYQGNPDGSDDPAPGVVIVSENIAAPAIKTRLRQQTGDDIFDFVISEDMIAGADDDTEVLQWLGAAEAVLGNATDPTVATELWRIIHLTTLNAPPPFLSKTLAQWQAMNPAHSWADSNARTILRGT